MHGWIVWMIVCNRCVCMMIIIYVSTKNSLGWIDGGVWMVEKMRETIGQKQTNTCYKYQNWICVSVN